MMLKFVLFCATLFVVQLAATPITDLKNSGTVDSSSSLILDESISIAKGEGNTSSQLSLGTLDISAAALQKSDYAILEQYAAIYENIRTEQENNILYKYNTQKSISTSVINANYGINKMKNHLIGLLYSLILNVENEIGGKATCLIGFDDRVAEIRSVIDTLVAYNSGIPIKIEELLVKIASWYGEVLELCIMPYPVLFTQIKDVELCVTSKVNTLELEKKYVTFMADNEISNLSSNSSFTTDYVSLRVTALISRAQNDYNFKACNSVI